MAEIRLDYQLSAKPVPWGGFIFLGVAVAVLLATIMGYRNLLDKSDEVEYRAAKIERASKRMHPGGHSNESMIKEVKRANEILRQISLPWGELFQTIESTASKNIALLGLEPDVERRQVRISGEAKNMESVLDYVGRLENHGVLGTVFLQSHHVQLQDPEKPVRFVIQANWKEHQ